MAQKIEIHITQDDTDSGMAYISLFKDSEEEEDNAAEGIFQTMMDAVTADCDSINRIDGH